ncbi:MAG: hypothetical protein LIP03_08280 [Bacteroidales bacterium]|nr:hypothetical protein [Bacteroidales bacterium]
MTWIMQEVSPAFRKHWLRFFFPGIDIGQVVEVRREQPDANSGDSRVDFFIDMADGNHYMIEVKIGDTNHHFGQYERAYGIPSARFGYIVNYEMEMDGYDVKTWEEFSLSMRALQPSDPEERSLISGYRQYLNSVCNIQIIDKPMRLNNLNSLYSLYTILGKLLNQPSAQPTLRPYIASAKPKAYSAGIQYVEFVIAECVYALFWINFEYEDPRIWICIPDINWDKNTPVVKSLQTFNNVNSEGGTYDKAAYYTKMMRGYWFRLQPTLLQNLESSDDVEFQKSILASFIKEVSGVVMKKQRLSLEEKPL